MFITTKLTTNVPSHNGGSPPAPATRTSSLAMTFDPATVSEIFRTNISSGIEHLEHPVSSTYKAGSSGSIVDQIFTHLTGELRFGSFITTIQSLTSSVPGPPSIYVPGGAVNRDLTIASGDVPDFPNHTFSGVLGVSINDGVAFCRSGQSIALNPASALNRINIVNNVLFNRSGNITLDSTGAHLSEILADLPVGVGWAADRTSNYLQATVTFGSTDLNQQLQPIFPTTRNSSGAAVLSAWREI